MMTCNVSFYSWTNSISFEAYLAHDCWNCVRCYVRGTLEENKFTKNGRGGGLMVCVLAFYSDDPSLNPADF